jgi:hypothetical protein
MKCVLWLNTGQRCGDRLQAVPKFALSKTLGWTMNRDTDKRLAASERNVLRRMFEGIEVNEK